MNVGNDGAIAVEGPKGKLNWKLPREISAKVENNHVSLARGGETRNVKALHGLSRALINNMVLEMRLPTIYAFREYIQAGGLMSYGANFPALFRRGAEFVDKILRGAKPTDIPVEQPVKFDLVINLTTARTLGLAIPDKLLALADEVIE